MEVLRGMRSLQLRLMRRLFAALMVSAVAVGLLPAQGTSLAPAGRWPVKTREHVDLWLHGFAMVSADSSPVPLYRRGYRDALLVARNAASAFTDLDANADALRTTLGSRPNLLGAQFIALSFGSWADLDGTFETFIKSDGNARGAKDPMSAAALAQFALIFRTREERDFARKFALSVRSEREKFHHQWWVAESRRRDPALAAVDSIWQLTIRPKLQPFLNHIQQSDGQIILSTVLEGEGRTVTDDKKNNTITCGFPETRERAMDAIHCVLHELVGPLTAAAVEDNTTPAEKRSGVADRLQAAALVRGGALLAAKLGVDVARSYMTFYLRAAGREPGSDVAAEFTATFVLPDGMISSIDRQIAVAFGGI